MRMGGFAGVLVGRAVVDRHGNGHVAQGIDGAHGAERRADDFAAFDLALVCEGSRIKGHMAFDAFAVGVEQQLVRVEAHAPVRIPWSADPVSVLHAIPCLGQVDVPQAVIRSVHAEQRFAQIERRNASGADAMRLRLVDERRVRFVEQTRRLGIEEAGAVERFQHAEPYLIGRFGPDDGVRASIIGEVETWTRRITMQGWILHKAIVGAVVCQTFDEWVVALWSNGFLPLVVS